MEKFNILYIDDSPEPGLARYLDEEYSNTEYEIERFEITFNPEDGYESLISDPKVKSANIIFIDSRLFENRTITSGKFSGEEFKIILRKYYPFIEVIVITQNGADSGIETISKYDSNCGKTASEYYSDYLPPYIEKAINNILVYRRLAERLKMNRNWESTLKEKIINSLNGISIYDELTKTDIDNLINSFKEVQEKINE
jgi:hypothetical protein